MQELIFSVGDLFNDSNQDGCLLQYNCKRFHIPAYQRGYKWGADDNGAVTVLLNDLWEAFETFKRRERREYYLQYITVKSISTEETNELEVIDGQQRITTLSIFLSIIAAKLNIPNPVVGKLYYAIRTNFFEQHIYQRDDLAQLLLKNWDDLILDEVNNRQDVYYLFHAAKRIDNFLAEKDNGLIPEFYAFVSNHVKVIVNAVERYITSEEVFKNLNSNKVPLTEVELIKGLLITRIGRSSTKGGHFKEILEIRTNVGRQWDEISRWANREDIRQFFFNGQNGMHQLLYLVAQFNSKEANKPFRISSDKDLNLFNYYHKWAIDNKAFEAIKTAWAQLDNWFSNDDLYNLIGFCRFAKNSKSNNLDFLLDCLNKTKPDLEDYLKGKKSELLKCDIENLYYGEENDTIHAILLALSVFPEGIRRRFDFHSFENERWSLEHIFPQSPEGKGQIMSYDQRLAVRVMLEPEISEEISGILSKSERSDAEKQVYYSALQTSTFLNSIGNMCLLTSSDNSSNGCLFFKEKRGNILSLIQQGSFVPKHTFDVFSKMIDGLSGLELASWTKEDIVAHKEYITKIIPKI